jgi:hypothetical protein
LTSAGLTGKYMPCCEIAMNNRRGALDNGT